MSFLNDLFGSAKPRITEEEFKKVRSDLASRGMSENKRDQVETLFSGDMNETVTAEHPKGIEKDELEMRIKWLRENKGKHYFSDKEIDMVEAVMTKWL